MPKDKLAPRRSVAAIGARCIINFANCAGASFGSVFLKTVGVGCSQVRGRQATMWDMVVVAAQNPALHWTVIAGAVLAYVYKLFSSGAGPLIGDMYGDDLDI